MVDDKILEVSDRRYKLISNFQNILSEYIKSLENSRKNLSNVQIKPNENWNDECEMIQNHIQEIKNIFKETKDIFYIDLFRIEELLKTLCDNNVDITTLYVKLSESIFLENYEDAKLYRDKINEYQKIY